MGVGCTSERFKPMSSKCVLYGAHYGHVPGMVSCCEPQPCPRCHDFVIMQHGQIMSITHTMHAGMHGWPDKVMLIMFMYFLLHACQSRSPELLDTMQV